MITNKLPLYRVRLIKLIQMGPFLSLRLCAIVSVYFNISIYNKPEMYFDVSNIDQSGNIYQQINQ